MKPDFVLMTTAFGGRDISAIKAAIPELKLCVDYNHDAMMNFLNSITFTENACIHLEDDVELCEGFYEKILAAVEQYPDRVINFFSLRKKDYEIGHPFEEKGAKYIGNCCYYLPKGYGQQIFEYYKRWPRRFEHPTGYDLLMADWMKENGIDYIQWFPHLVNHLYGTSLINSRRPKNRVDRRFNETNGK